MKNDIARVVDELFQKSGLGGFTVPYENEATQRWNIWYVIPHRTPDASGRHQRSVLLVSTIDDANGERVLGAEVCLEGSGATLYELEPVALTPEAVAVAAQQLVDWARKRFGVGNELEDRLNFVDIASDAFMASGLEGKLYPNNNEHLADVMYVLPKKDGDGESIVLSMETNKKFKTGSFKGDACGEETGTIFFEIPSTPLTEESVRAAVAKLIEWAKAT